MQTHNPPIKFHQQLVRLTAVAVYGTMDSPRTRARFARCCGGQVRHLFLGILFHAAFLLIRSYSLDTIGLKPDRAL